MIPLLGAASVALAAPTITAVNISSLSEGSAGTFRASYTATGSASVAWAYGNGDTGTGALASYTYADNGTWTVRVTVTDSTGSASTTRVVSVANVAPTITAADGDTTGDEGGTFAFDCAATDPGADTVTYRWDFGDGDTEGGASITHTYADDGAYTAICTASDEDSAAATSSLAVVVANVAPTLTITGGAGAVEGDTLAFDAGTVDPGTADTQTYVWSWGDGESETGSLAANSHTYLDDGTYTLRVTAVDDDGGIGSDSASITVANGAPTAIISGDASGDEGDVLSWACAASDPGLADVLTTTWDFGDGATAAGTTASYAFADDGTYTVLCTVTDDSGAADTDGLTVVIANVSPSLTAVSGDVSTDEGSSANFTAAATDAGADTLTYTWDLAMVPRKPALRSPTPTRTTAATPSRSSWTTATAGVIRLV